MKTNDKLKYCSSLYAEILDACQCVLNTDEIAKCARNYLNSRISTDTQKEFGFGYFPSNNNLGFLTSLVDKKILEKANLIYPRYISGGIIKTGHFNNHNIVFPFKDEYGNIVSIIGRSLLSEEERKEKKVQKYKYTYKSNKDLYVYGLDRAKKSILDKNYVICVEGQFDAITCYSYGINNVVALGWANLTKYQFFSLNKYTNNFMLLLDNDEAGAKAKSKIKNYFSKYAKISSISIDKLGYKDIDECLRKDAANREKVVDWLNNL